MARLIFIAVLFISSNVIISGQIPIQILLYDLCEESPVRIDWEIVNSMGETIKKNNEGEYLLKEGEKYFASTTYFRDQYMKLLNLTFTVNNESKNKVVEVPRITKFFSGNSVHFNEVFLNCNTLCDGECIDFHTNGTPRLKGKFIDGRPKGRVKYYNPSGEIILIEKYSKRGLLKKSINKNHI